MKITNAQIDALTEEASELSDMLTETVRLWVAARLKDHPADALMAVSGGALTYSLAECCGQFIGDDTIIAWAALLATDVANISRDLQRSRPH